MARETLLQKSIEETTQFLAEARALGNVAEAEKLAEELKTDQRELMRLINKTYRS